MEKKEKYEQMYEMLVTYERKIHEKNQKRISIGLKCIIIIPLIFLFLLFWTESNKVVFLILWIVSLFLLAAYLILVEYMDYNLQEKLSEINDEGRRVDSLIGLEIDNVPGNLRNVIQRIDDGLNSEAEMVASMNHDSILFAMANPVPEIMPDVAKAAGARIVGTGRSDFPNQVNNVVAFPGIFKGALEGRATQITEEMKLAAAEAIAGLVPADKLSDDNIMPEAFDPQVAEVVADAVKSHIH